MEASLPQLHQGDLLECLDQVHDRSDHGLDVWVIRSRVDGLVRRQHFPCRRLGPAAVRGAIPIAGVLTAPLLEVGCPQPLPGAYQCGQQADRPVLGSRLRDEEHHDAVRLRWPDQCALGLFQDPEHCSSPLVGNAVEDGGVPTIHSDARALLEALGHVAQRRRLERREGLALGREPRPFFFLHRLADLPDLRPISQRLGRRPLRGRRDLWRLGTPRLP